MADKAEKTLFQLFESEDEHIQVNFQKLEERPPLNSSEDTALMVESFKAVSQHWRLPFSTESSLVPTAAGEVPLGIPVLSGMAPAGKDVYTPNESVHRGELLQRTMLLTQWLLQEEGIDPE